jgi:hypothetical protein
MIYTPKKNPKEATILIALIAGIGIFGGYFVHKYFLVFALLFWMQYTIVLSYLQFKHGSKHTWNNFTEYLLHPQLRFFLFETLAVMGLVSVLLYDWLQIGAVVLLVWMGFAVNFYIYYNDFVRYE